MTWNKTIRCIFFLLPGWLAVNRLIKMMNCAILLLAKKYTMLSDADTLHDPSDQLPDFVELTFN